MASLSPNPLPASPVTDAGIRANELHEAAKIAVARVQEARDAGGAAQTKWQAAQVALEAELKRGAIEGIDTELEHKLSVEVDATARLASHGVITGRIKIAETVAQHAVDAYNVM